LTQTTAGSLIILDTLHPLLSLPQVHIPTFLSTLMSLQTSVLATYHLDIPLPSSPSHTPHPLTLLKYLATTLFTVHSFHHILAQKAARDRAEPEPLFGYGAGGEEVEGVLVGVGSNDARGVVVEMEYRRRSGRGISETFFLPSFTSSASSSKTSAILLEDHPLYARPVEADEGDGGEVESTFSLGLTEKQRRDREGVVLPYFDAQNVGDGGGEGGRILYDMGVEDDFDEEEDEI
jgi:elongator complex protein 5